MAFSERSPLATPQARDALNRLIDGFQTLVREHLALAKVELKDDLRRMGRSAVLCAAGVPALLAGYLLFNVAIALALALALPSWAAFGIVAVANLGAGAALTAHFLKKARATSMSLGSTGTELRRDREMLSSITSAAGSSPPPVVETVPPERAPAPARPSWTPAPRADGDGGRRASQPPPAATPRGEPVTPSRGNLAH
jgi:uncharacterized membrane protein YqjE